MAKIKSKRYSVPIILLILVVGVILGELTTFLTKDIAALSWLSIGQTVGLTSPVVLNLSVITFTLGFTLHLNVAVILGILISALFYRFVF